MTVGPGPTGNGKPTVNIEPPEPKPIFTVLLICCMPLFCADGKIDWVQHHAFTASAMTQAVTTQNWGGLLTTMFTAALGELSPWIWLLNSFFVWVFGHILEKNLKSWRYPTLLLLSVILGWTLVYIQAGLTPDKEYIGPSMMLFGLLGAYFVFLPKKPFKPQQWVRPNTEIFRNEKQQTMHERYFVNPWIYITAFLVYQVLLQLALNVGKDWFVAQTHIQQLAQVHQTVIGRMQSVPAAFNPISAIMAIASGAMVASVLPKLAMSLKPKRPGGKLQLEVIQHYRELRTLDMTHEQACEGAARFAAVPIDIAKDWISKGSAGLKDQNIH